MRSASLRSPCVVPSLPTIDGGPLPLVLDTDAYNEVDDQFSIAYALRSGHSVDLQACYAAPFLNARSTSPADGMEKSYREIERIYTLNDSDPTSHIFRGAGRYLGDQCEPVESEAVRDLIGRARATREGPLYVACTAAATNVASAILLEPSIRDQIVVVWLGGHPYTWHRLDEFNLAQDPAAARVLFDSGVSLIHVPCKNVSEHLRTTVAELRAGGLTESDSLSAYLLRQFEEVLTRKQMRSKPLWDLAPIGLLINHAWVPTVVAHSPRLTSDQTWSHDPTRHLIRVATDVARDAIIADVLAKLVSSGRET